MYGRVNFRGTLDFNSIAKLHSAQLITNNNTVIINYTEIIITVDTLLIYLALIPIGLITLIPGSDSVLFAVVVDTAQ